ncbi:MAG: MiaB/RimO family radical SAM methylthiotransferase [bacterium]|nr:MiaB/RimO family radical SAM methylthiotransferase [bacterium]MDD5354903.1 MiaB/RimO family radical SAM methylthiotransferase [bacterium]MDD5756081.1 MiaB/RimO family radical SAM methylthiotransferase [bacterium]
MKTFKIYTLGCKINQYDSQVIREDYQRRGYVEITAAGPADLYIINTCTVTASADKKSRHYIHYAHRENPHAEIVVTGCYARLDARVLAKIPGVTKVTPIKPALPAISGFQDHARPFLKIQDGCNNSCSYCKVHIVRGRSRSKPLANVIAEAKQLAGRGFREIVLCGVCLGLYGQDLKPKTGLLQVIKALEKIKGLERIRLSSLEAWDLTNALIDQMARSGKLCRHLHIPIQSGADSVLRRMNRRASFKLYSDLLKTAQKKVPGIGISTDIMVGFPGETNEDFKTTVKLLKAVKPMRIHIFPYSRRTGTAAASFQDPVPANIIIERFNKMKALARAGEIAFMKRFINKIMPVLFEDRVKEAPGFWEGHTDNYLKIRVRSTQNLKNQLIRVKLRKIQDDHILANIC